MPLYEYKCEKCEELFEYMEKLADKPKSICEDCGGEIKRTMSTGGFVLKGGGWYRDGYTKPPKENKFLKEVREKAVENVPVKGAK